MKIVIAMDSFKGSLSSLEAGRAVADGIYRAASMRRRKNAGQKNEAAEQPKIEIKPLADGGEGTTEALVAGLGGRMVSAVVSGPLGERLNAQYGILPDERTAVLEMAAAAGLALVPGERRPFDATTYGVGELICSAVKEGCRRFMVGIGGSATNDGGIGMLEALGFEFLDKAGEPVPPGAKGLGRVETIRAEHVLSELRECSFQVACDVTNPLCGTQGATFVFGPQKGVREEEKEALDAAMYHFAGKAAEFNGRDCKKLPGAGAAGGLGFAFLSFLNAELRSGIDLVMDAAGLEESLGDADYVVTGEGRLDGQSAMGKAPVGVARAAKKQGVKVIVLAGSLGPGAEVCNDAGVDAFFSVLTNPVSLEEAMEPKKARENISRTSEQLFRLLLS